MTTEVKIVALARERRGPTAFGSGSHQTEAATVLIFGAGISPLLLCKIFGTFFNEVFFFFMYFWKC